MVQVRYNASKTLNESYHSQLLIELEFLERYRSRHITPSQLHLCNRETFLFHFNDMKRSLKKLFKSKKPSPGTIHGLGPATSTSTSAGPTDLMLSIPACDFESDGTTRAQVAAGVSVRVQLHPSHP